MNQNLFKNIYYSAVQSVLLLRMLRFVQVIPSYLISILLYFNFVRRLVWCWFPWLLQVFRFQSEYVLGWSSARMWEIWWISGRTNNWKVNFKESLNIPLISFLYFSQIQFLSELALLEGGFTGIGFWYIGLTDLGNFWTSCFTGVMHLY